jgi:hypothetical protein
MTTDYRKQLEAKHTEYASLFDRMDTDRNLVNLVEYVLRDTENKEIPHAISVTLNDPLVFAVSVESSLGQSSEQITVESNDKKLDTTLVEEFIRALFAEANRILSRQGRWNLDPFIDQMNCRRGRSAARCVVKLEDDRLIPEITGWDTRFTDYIMDRQGLYAGRYKITRSRDAIQVDYPDYVFEKEGTSFDVEDIWARDVNQIWVDSKLALEQKNPFKSVPVAVQVVPMGSMMADADTMKYQGESIFFMIRDLIPELNRIASIIQSLNTKALDHALQLKVPIEDLPLKEVPSHDDVTKPNAVNPVPSTGGYDLMPLGQLQQQAWILHQMIETRIQRGGVSNFDTGTFSQPMSAVALVHIGEGRDQVFMPRLGSRGLLKEQLARMGIEQTLMLCKAAGISTVRIGHQTYDITKLEGEYEITFKYFIKSPKIEIARYSMAAAAGDLISNKTKRVDILQQEDPEGEERLLRSEEAERLSPRIKMFRTVKSLLEDSEKGVEDAELEAQILASELNISIENVLEGRFEEPKPEESQKPTQLMPLMDGNTVANTPVGRTQNG